MESILEMSFSSFLKKERCLLCLAIKIQDDSLSSSHRKFESVLLTRTAIEEVGLSDVSFTQTKSLSDLWTCLCHGVLLRHNSVEICAL